MSMAMAAAIACTGCTSSDTNPSAGSGTSTQITTAASDTSAKETDSKKSTASAESLSTLQDNVTGGGFGDGMPAGDPPSGAPGGNFGKNAQCS